MYPSGSQSMEAVVSQSHTLVVPRRAAKRRGAWQLSLATMCLAGLLTTTASHAVDGCLVLLCFATPNWRAIPQCVPPIS